MTDAGDLRRFHDGAHERLWELLGAHITDTCTRFAVWAPNASSVAVVGDWNDWSSVADPMHRIADSGVWSVEVPGGHEGALYKYAVTGSDGTTSLRADPLAAMAEPGGTASRVFRSRHTWQDHQWMDGRRSTDPVKMRLSAYEVHLGSWRWRPDGSHLGYRELAPLLADHVERLGFTHVELLPVAEHPYDPSWGYQVTGYYAPTSRFGDPDDFRWFVDHLHRRGIGVIADWVPAHFPRDDWALARFDGTALYEHADPQRAEHPDWGTYEFDFARPEVRSFLISNALFWLAELHVDGLRVDAVASILYLDYSRAPGKWSPNVRGGNEDLDAISFLQQLNTVVHRAEPGVLTIAEESTAWDGVTRPVHAGGLGFTHKWNMGWMHDTLTYWSTAPHHRRWHHEQLTFGLSYAWAEHFLLPLSHDEVVHLKRPLIGKLPGDERERFADLRALFAWMWAHPGKQLLFMGAELADEHEWSHDRQLDWSRVDHPLAGRVAVLLSELNRLQAEHPCLHASDGLPAGFAWLVVDDAEHSTLAFERHLPGDDDVVVVVANLATQPRSHYRLGLCRGGPWSTVLCTDERRFGGSLDVLPAIAVEPTRWQGRAHSAELDLPARSVTYLVPGAR